MATRRGSTQSSEKPEAVEAPVSKDYAERSYADAVTPEHAEKLRDVGQFPKE